MPTAAAWQAVEVEAPPTPANAHLEHLAQIGALDEAERIIEGSIPCTPIPIDQFLKQVRKK